MSSDRQQKGCVPMWMAAHLVNRACRLDCNELRRVTSPLFLGVFWKLYVKSIECTSLWAQRNLWILTMKTVTVCMCSHAQCERPYTCTCANMHRPSYTALLAIVLIRPWCIKYFSRASKQELTSQSSFCNSPPSLDIAFFQRSHKQLENFIDNW